MCSKILVRPYMVAFVRYELKVIYTNLIYDMFDLTMIT